MPLSFRQKRFLESSMVGELSRFPAGISSRELITLTMKKLPFPANRRHAAGMLAWILKAYPYRLKVRYPGYIVCA